MIKNFLSAIYIFANLFFVLNHWADWDKFGMNTKWVVAKIFFFKKGKN